MSDKWFYAGIGVITIGIILAGIVLASQTSRSAKINKESKAVVKLPQTAHNWGTIGINNGDVTTLFPIINKGKDPLIISDVKTSCMCTTAQVIFNKKKSPIFGMHTKSAYELEIPPNKKAFLKVIFNPAYHGPNGLGPIVRQVSFATNDPKNELLTVTVKAKVVQ